MDNWIFVDIFVGHCWISYWFADIDLRALENMEITPPIIPNQDGEDNMQYFKTT